MVHALQTVHALLAADGILVDIHPSRVPAPVEVHASGRIAIAGVVVEDEDGIEYDRADRALDEVVRLGLFGKERHETFEFVRYADTLDELLQNLAETWEGAHIPEDTRARARTQMEAAGPAARIAVRETVRIARVRKLDVPAPGASHPGL